MRFLASILALAVVAGCAHSPEPIVVERQVPVLPPANLLAKCPSGPSDGTVGGELQRLAAIVACEWGKDAALGAWAAAAGSQ